MLEVLDTAGQEEYTSLRDQWIRDGEGFVLVYSITSRSSFSHIRTYFKQIQRARESLQGMSPPVVPGTSVALSQSGWQNSGPAPVMLVANKIDRGTERDVSTQEGIALAKELGCMFVEASAKNCINVEKAFYDVVRQLRHQRRQSAKAEKRPLPPGSGSSEGIKKNIGRGPGKRGAPKCVIL